MREPLLEEVEEGEGRSERELGPPESDRRGSNPGSATWRRGWLASVVAGGEMKSVNAQGSAAL